MYIYLKPFIVWPGREEVLKTMPDGFKTEFDRCIYIIGCFEDFCERPSDLISRYQTYSNYKHLNIQIYNRHHTAGSHNYPLCLKVREVECPTSISLKTVACLAIFNQVTKC